MKTFIEMLKEKGFKGKIREDLKEEYEQNISRFKRDCGPVIFPVSIEDVELSVKVANILKVQLYPLSQGKNWGFGSRLPVKSGAVIVDLSLLNKIREVNLEFGYAIIEPGVTQIELANQLRKMGAPFYLDVTGSGAETSIIGNALERGIAYNSLRVDTVFNFEVILGDGTVLKTGFESLGASPLNSLYSHGVGPGLHHLFFQSNFGIVTGATVRLHRQQPASLDFKISFNDDKLLAVIDQIGELKKRGVIKSICRTGDFSRSFETMAPLLLEEYEKLGFKLTANEIYERYSQQNKFEWTSFGKIDGEPEEVEFKKKQIKKRISPHAKIQFYTNKKIKQICKFAFVFKQWDLYCSLKASESLRLLSSGTPSNAALKMTAWDSKIGGVFTKVDASPLGLILVVPLCPLSGFHVQKMVELTRRICKKYDVDLGITLNTISESVIEGVISIKFKIIHEAHNCMKELYKNFEEFGNWPYRLNVEVMDTFIKADNPFWKVAKQIKRALDPNHILGPGRYETGNLKDSDLELQ